MNILSKAMQREILDHAEQEYPKECCGFIISVGKAKKYIRCENRAADNAKDEFVISQEDYINAEDQGEILAVVHSHPDSTSTPSIRDRAVCSATEVAWVIVSYPEVDFNVITPEKAPLIGRPFAHGTDWDCYGLIRDYYDQKLDTKLDRFNHDSFWWEEGKDLYTENFPDWGFVKVPMSSLKKHDVIIMQIQAKVPNHGAIYLGDNKILHHMFGKLSRVDVYGGYWMENTSYVLRHKSQM